MQPDLARELALAAPIVLITHTLGAIAAYGSTLLALPPLAALLGDMRLTVHLLRFTGTLQSGQVALQTWRDTDWRELGRMLAWASLGMAPGLALGGFLPRTPLLLLLAATLLAGGITGLRVRGDSPRPLGRGVGALLLIASGLIHGAFACGGALLVIYASRQIPDKGRFRSTLSFFWVAINLLPIIGWFLVARLGTREWWLLVSLSLLAVVSCQIGELAARRLPQVAFLRLVAGLLLASGAITLWNAIPRMP